MSRIARLLGLQEGELRNVARLALVYGGLGGATAIADALVQAAFLARAGADALPWVLGARAAISPVLAWVYSRIAPARASRGVLAGLCTLAALTSIGASVAIERGATGAIAAYAAHEIVTGLLTLHWGVYLLDHLEQGAARRGVAPIYAAARGTAALGGVAVGLLVPSLSIQQALWIAAAVFLVVAPCAFVPESPDAVAPTPKTGTKQVPLRRGWQLLRSSTLLQTIAISTLVMVLVRTTLRYGQQSILDAYPEAVLAPLLGWYVAGANTLSVVLQLGVTSRLLERFGVGTTNALYAWSTALAQVLLMFVHHASLVVALGVRFAEHELKHALKTPVSPLFYEGFWGADRVRARAFVLGFVSPVAQVVAALGLGVLVLAPDGTAAIAGSVAGAVYVLSSIAQGRAHRTAMEQLPTQNAGESM